MIRKVGERWCSSDGEERFFFDSCFDVARAQELEDGSARLEVRLAPEGKGFVNGPWEFDLTPAQVTQAIANFRKRGAPVAVRIGHVPSKDRGTTPAAAWIENMYRKVMNGHPFLMAMMRFLPKTWSAVKSDEYKFLSVELFEEDTDQHGNEIGMNVDGCAILNDPFFPLKLDQQRLERSRLMLARISGSEASEETKEEKEIDLAAGLEIREVEGQHCIFNPAGENLGCHPTAEEARAAMEAMGMTGKDSTAARTDAGKKDTDGKDARDGQVDAGKKPEMVQLSKEDHEKLKADSVELATMKKKGADEDSRVITLEKTVKELKEGREADQLKLKAQRIRGAVATLTKEHKVLIRLGDHKLETDEGAIKFLESRPFGVSDVEGLEKLASDIRECAHLPRVNLGSEAGGGVRGATGDLDLGTKQGRADAVRLRVVALKKEFPAEELEVHLSKRHQTAEQFARQELKLEHPTVEWDKD